MISPRSACSGRSGSPSIRRRGSGTTQHIGGERCPVVNTWWQTETGMILLTPLPGVTTTKPGSATKPFPGEGGRWHQAGEQVAQGGGYLVLERPWPAMTRGIFGDDARFRETYWERFPRSLLRGRRRAHRRRRGLLAPRPRRRCDERLRTQALDDRGRVRSRCRPPEGGGGGGLWALGRNHRAGDRRLRDAQGWRSRVARDARRVAGARGAQDRCDREAGEHRLHAGATQDPLGRGHAGGSCATLRRTARSATRPPSPTRASSASSPIARPRRRAETRSRSVAPAPRSSYLRWQASSCEPDGGTSPALARHSQPHRPRRRAQTPGAPCRTRTTGARGRRPG